MRTFRHDGVKNSRFYSIYETSRVTKRKKFPHLIIGFIVFLVVVLLMIESTRLSVFQVRQITVEHAQTIDPSVIVSRVDKLISGTYFWLIPKRNIALVSTSNVRDILLREYPRIADVSVSRDSLASLKIDILERKSRYLWCEKNNKDSPCYYMDEHGFIFDRAPTFSGTMYLEFVGGLYADDPTGKKVLSDSSIASILSIIRFLETLSSASGATSSDQYQINKVILRDDGDSELVVSNSSGTREDWRIIFSVSQDISKLFKRIDVAFSTIDKSRHAGRMTQDLSYIDMRFGRKVYYKFRDEVL